MKNDIIKYIGFYDTFKNSEEKRNSSVAATNKMDYICSALNKNGYKVRVVSPSRTTTNKFFKGSTVKINEENSLKLFCTFPWGGMIQKAFSIVMGDLMLFWYLITRVRRRETILVYHSLGLRSVVRIAKKLKKFKIILEVEEVYQDVVSYPKRIKRNEYKAIDCADKYIFPTEFLNEKINNGKPYVIIHGTYQVEQERKCKFGDDKIHVVYAGTFDPRKGGVLAAITAEHLPKNYHVHIIGFGSEEEVKNMQNTVKEVANRAEATITYDGLLKGEEYIQFLQKCDIGLSTQIPDATYNETSFPSKILSYMSNGLRVVSVRIKAIEMSDIGNSIFYYKEQTPMSIAQTIMAIDINDEYDSRELIKTLDERFSKEINTLLR